MAEWQRRATLVALVRDAPAGTVVVQERGRGGPAMQVYVGDGQDSGGTGVTQECIPKDVAEQVEALWEQERSSLQRHAMLRTGGDKPAAEDLVQQAFMAAALQWESLAGRDPVERGQWLRSVCRNKWIDSIRKEATGERLQPGMARLYARTGPDPADTVIAREDLERCWQVIQALPPRRREVALLYFIEQQSVMRIAELLDLQPSGVRKHVAKARGAIREAVGGVLGDSAVETGAVREGEGEQA
ncbi:sigma-70 family RNA polymerase sigma factor (plasmid) [Streptomyces sp. NBC_01281]|uniref:RNA polymerase sigma factor n=1 Tax=Streptomyces sp. NBC_01281 TaxID=2903811 RepID=UPI002E156175|nr:sigma-70 family RNA polymerase sigma factor [Streptomyces sp. NBC_01281]